MKRLTTEEFIKKAHEVHGDKYDYSKVEYINSQTKVCIICPEHGEFWQTPNAHIHQKQGCSYCCGKKLNTQEFIQKSFKIHGKKYDYSKVDYVNAHTKVCIICPEHGEFWQTPNKHLLNANCPKCVNQYSPTTEEWIERAKEVHGDKYDYSKVEYINCNTPVCVICPKHGEFFIYPNNHLKGNGCPKCRVSKLEKMMIDILMKNNIEFTYNKHFVWLKNIKPLSIDFYLPDYNIAIECQGEQHLINNRTFKNKNNNYLLYNDTLKNKLCFENNIKLFYFGETDLEKINLNKSLYNEDNYFKNRHNLLNKILRKIL